MVIDRWWGVTRYTNRRLYDPAMLGPSQPRHISIYLYLSRPVRGHGSGSSDRSPPSVGAATSQSKATVDGRGRPILSRSSRRAARTGRRCSLLGQAVQHAGETSGCSRVAQPRRGRNCRRQLLRQLRAMRRPQPSVQRPLVVAWSCALVCRPPARC